MSLEKIPQKFQDKIREPELFINGELRSATSDKVFEKKYPATGEPLYSFKLASAADVDLAVESAQKGFREWSSYTAMRRGHVLQKAAQLVRDGLEELAFLEVLDTGKPISEARTIDIPSAADGLEYYGGIAASIHGQHYDFGSSFVYTRREPLGVCAGIGAWNYPFQLACWKSAPALAAGNAMVYKASEWTPLSTLRLAEIYKEAGLPDGVFNVVQGASEVGTLLTNHPGISKVTFTGSVPTGKKIMQMASATLKTVTLELGGKSPLILFPDCDFDQAVSGALIANFLCQGEICLNGTRVFVHESIHDAFVDHVASRAEKIRVGDPLDPQTQMGALIHQDHLKKVCDAIESGKKEGAQLVCGGKAPEWNPSQQANEKGYFLKPTLFSGCTDEMKITQEEIFGPVMSVLKFKTEEEVISRANQTHFGLAAGVFTDDVKRAHRVVAQLQAGMCWINNYGITPIEVPFGGYKQSGIGRENGLAVLDHFTQIKTVYVELGKPESPFSA